MTPEEYIATISDKRALYKGFYSALLIAKDGGDRKNQIRLQKAVWDLLTIWGISPHDPLIKEWGAEVSVMHGWLKELLK